MTKDPDTGPLHTTVTPEQLAQLDAYSKACTIYAQIASFQTWVLASATLFVTLTAAVWTAALSNDVALAATTAACIGHLVACGWLFGVFYGSLRSIRARFVMFDRLGEIYFPDIGRIGASSFADQHPKARRWLTSGSRSRVYRFFYLLPFAGVVGTVYLFSREVT